MNFMLKDKKLKKQLSIGIAIFIGVVLIGGALFLKQQSAEKQIQTHSYKTHIAGDCLDSYKNGATNYLSSEKTKQYVGDLRSLLSKQSEYATVLDDFNGYEDIPVWIGCSYNPGADSSSFNESVPYDSPFRNETGMYINELANETDSYTLVSWTDEDLMTNIHMLYDVNGKFLDSLVVSNRNVGPPGFRIIRGNTDWLVANRILIEGTGVYAESDSWYSLGPDFKKELEYIARGWGSIDAMSCNYPGGSLATNDSYVNGTLMIFQNLSIRCPQPSAETWALEFRYDPQTRRLIPLNESAIQKAARKVKNTLGFSLYIVGSSVISSLNE